MFRNVSTLTVSAFKYLSTGDSLGPSKSVKIGLYWGIFFNFEGQSGHEVSYKKECIKQIS